MVIKTFVGSNAKIITDLKLNEINEHGFGMGLSASDVEGLLLIALDNEITKENVPYSPFLSFLSLGRNAMSLIYGTYGKEFTMDRK